MAVRAAKEAYRGGAIEFPRRRLPLKRKFHWELMCLVRGRGMQSAPLAVRIGSGEYFRIKSPGWNCWPGCSC